ncbi:GlsB/YeaQ/YmgE family stress response membrane protein [Maribellus maritimus]|uniref:GlsB/YeaQ/YmgE family stress response membrane protein n=1 Tax=Maribellus maritimus TaxID=2870838 RepID=UPI001EEB0549|nr:GlsB/YeaQ/YmgE family stress response membrane protein [Maribellus maritimus]MCG6188390.1 GlsB/YeaQ/YmgE family stress response membrane protein [Maribellus maritimus]
MLYILIIGLAAGAIAGLIMRGKGYGFIVNLIIGIAGAYFGHWLFNQVGIHIHGGTIGTLFLSVVGAVVLLYLFSLFKKILDK